MTRKKQKKPSLILFFLILIGAILFGHFIYVFLIADSIGQGGRPEPASSESMIIGSILFFVGGCFFLLLAIGWYLIVLVTGCFTFNYHKPIWNLLRFKLYFSNLLLTIFVTFGLGGLVFVLAGPIMDMMGLNGPMFRSMPVLVIACLFIASTAWFDLWKPLGKVFRKRLLSRNIPEEHIKQGILMGISNPEKSSFKKFPMVEEDIGMFWIWKDFLEYRGDRDDFKIYRDNLIDIERKVDRGSVSAYGGAVPVILQFYSPDGSERRVRLHMENYWTTRSAARALDRLADELNRWKDDSPDSQETTTLEEPLSETSPE